MVGFCNGLFVAGVTFGAAVVYEAVAANVSNVATGSVLDIAPCPAGSAAAPAADRVSAATAAVKAATYSVMGSLSVETSSWMLSFRGFWLLLKFISDLPSLSALLAWIFSTDISCSPS